MPVAKTFREDDTAIVERVGIAEMKDCGLAVLFHRVRVKNSAKFRVWPCAGDYRYLELDPSEWTEKYRVVAEHRTSAPPRPT